MHHLVAADVDKNEVLLNRLLIVVMVFLKNKIIRFAVFLNLSYM